MSLQRRPVCVVFPALSALEGLLPGVLPLVREQLGPRRENLQAVTATVGTGEQGIVVCQGQRAGEDLM